MLSRRIVLPVIALVLLAACGDHAKESDSTASTDVSTTIAITTTTLATPTVDLPAELPTELVVTDLIVGTGPAAREGDTVVVNYVGVRSEDGTEFDNSYTSGAPIDVPLGAGQVIPGWDQGLVGVQAGGRRQLDIPAELAYGDTPQGDIIQPGDALTFVIDVVAVIPAADPALEPTVSVAPSANVESFSFEDLVVGEGASPVAGQTAAVQIVAYRADTGEKINTTWTTGTPFTFTFGTGEVLPGIDSTVDGMKVGGRRQATIPFAMAFGDAGNDSLGLPPSTDLVLVLDLVAVY